jgi:hypothetical protein
MAQFIVRHLEETVKARLKLANLIFHTAAMARGAAPH